MDNASVVSWIVLATGGGLGLTILGFTANIAMRLGELKQLRKDFDDLEKRCNKDHEEHVLDHALTERHNRYFSGTQYSAVNPRKSQPDSE